MTIRRIPTDFLVEELPRPAFLEALSARRAGYAVWRLLKESQTTPQAVDALAKALAVKPGRADYAGLKDKHARTVQHVTVPERDLAGPAPSALSGRGWSAEFLGWSPRPASAETILGNRFTVVVRDLTLPRAREMGRRAALLRASPGSLLVMNYFGDQRFGSARHGRGFAARCLIHADFEGALRLLIGSPARKDSGNTRQFTRLCAQKWGDWPAIAGEAPRVPERRAVEALAQGASFRDAFCALPDITQTMAVEAYQSHLWNETARNCARTIDAGALRSDDAFGELVFPRAGSVTAEWVGIEVPMMAGETRLEGSWSEAAGAALRSEGLAVTDLRVPGLRRPRFGEATRPLLVTTTGFEMSDPAPDELSAGSKRLRRTVLFDLPRGAYATVVLRALGE